MFFYFSTNPNLCSNVTRVFTDFCLHLKTNIGGEAEILTRGNGTRELEDS